jgi:hypothetical protein
VTSSISREASASPGQRRLVLNRQQARGGHAIVPRAAHGRRSVSVLPAPGSLRR